MIIYNSSTSFHTINNNKNNNKTSKPSFFRCALFACFSILVLLPAQIHANSDPVQQTFALAQENQLLANSGTGSTSDLYGFSVAIDGDNAIVGAPGYNNKAGAVYFLTKFNSGSWTQKQAIEAGTDVDVDDWFGFSVAIRGDIAVIGSPGEEEIGSAYGAAYIYKYNSSTDLWEYDRKLFAVDVYEGSDNMHFGAAVAISDDHIVVGAPSKGSTGACYVFDITTFTRTELTYDTESVTIDQYFGSTVDIDGDEIVVGYYKYDSTSNENVVGALVYVVNGTSGAWEHDGQDLTGPVIYVIPIGVFGSLANGIYYTYMRVAIKYEDTILLASRFGGDSNNGEVFLFEYNDSQSSYALSEVLEPTDPTSDALFGSSIDISDGFIVIGAADEGDAGSIYLYQKNDSGNWKFEEALTPSDASSTDSFYGFSVALSEQGSLIVGGPSNNDDTGSVYVYNKDYFLEVIFIKPSTIADNIVVFSATSGGAEFNSFSQQYQVTSMSSTLYRNVLPPTYYDDYNVRVQLYKGNNKQSTSTFKPAATSQTTGYAQEKTKNFSDGVVVVTSSDNLSIQVKYAENSAPSNPLFGSTFNGNVMLYLEPY